MTLQRLRLAHLPTPLERHRALDELVGTELWIKRDDMNEAGASGNKIRKLEYLLPNALARGATRLVTCGGAQSNHARATALVAAARGLGCTLLLRTPDPAHPPPIVGNLLIDRMAGAEVRFITPKDYARRKELMEEVARDLSAQGEVPYVIPEGGSNGLGALGYVAAMQEVREQLDRGLGGGPAGFDAIAVACGSGGTAAGVALGAQRYQLAPLVLAIAVCDDRSYFDAVIARIMDQALGLDPEVGRAPPPTVHDAFKGPAYGIASPAQIDLLLKVVRTSGILLDPVYTVKAFYGLSQIEPKPRRALFIHTGGLPGLLAQADTLVPRLST